jgi:predicted metal-binding membrane protein
VVAAAFASSAPRVHLLRRLTWLRPEWPWALLALGAWVVLALHSIARMDMGSHAAGAHGRHDLSVSTLGGWMLMTVAMMVPAALPLLREISLASLWMRRYRSAALFLAGYLAVWGVFGTAALGAWAVVSAGTPSASAALVTGLLLLGAAAWGLSAAKRRSLKRCHRFVPLPPRGRAADEASLRFGLYHGRHCLAVCWPLMLSVVPGHTLVSMLGVTALVTWERLARLPRLRVGAFVLAVAGALLVFVGA